MAIKSLGFTFRADDARESRAPIMDGHAVLAIRFRDGDSIRVETFDPAELPTTMQGALMQYGTKQKLSDYEAAGKVSMTPAQRVESIKKCWTMLATGAWSEGREPGSMVPPTVEEVVAAVMRFFPEAIEADVRQMALDNGLDSLDERILGMVKVIRAEAALAKKVIATGGTTTDLGSMFKTK